MLSSYRTEQMTKISRLNADLDVLANGGRKLSFGSISSESLTPIISGPLIDYHKRIQRHARLLHSMLNEKLGFPMCKCSVPHGAHLELKIRLKPPTKVHSSSQSQADIQGPNQFLTFSLLMSSQTSGGHAFTGIWQEFLLEPIHGNRQFPADHNGNNARFLLTPPQLPAAEESSSSSSSSLESITPARGRDRTLANLLPHQLRTVFSAERMNPLTNHPPNQSQRLSPAAERYVRPPNSILV